MCSVTLNDEQNNLIKRILKNENINNYELTTKSGSMKGDGYLGVITTVDVKDKDTEQELHLILKAAHQIEEFRQQAPIRLAYLREIFIYETLFKEFRQFETEKGNQEPFSATAKCYGVCTVENNECILLENLREIGYKMWSRMEPMNAEHIALVFKEYGKFHAISLAMKHYEPEHYRNLEKKLTNIFDGMPEEVLKSMVTLQFERGYKALQNNPRELEALRKFELEIIHFFKTVLQTDDQNFVVNHGDCWNNNMMFKYEDIDNPSKPTKVCLLDWQISKAGSPVLDLSYFFYVCSPLEILKDYKTYWNIYYDSLSLSLKNMGCNPNEIFPFDVLQNHWKKYSKFGLYMALMVIKIMLSEVEEIPDISEMTQNGKKFLEAFDYNSVNVNRYNKRIQDLVGFLVDNDFL